MKVQIRERDLEVSEVLRAHVERRLSFALGRFGERIGRVVVRFSDAAGDGRGLDKRCEINVGLRARSVRVEDTDADLFAAVNHAADRVARSISRMLERERDWEEP